jgi:hypothetical protein
MATKPNTAPIQHLIEFDEATHSYFCDGELVISTTQVFRDAAMVDARWFTEFHRWRGSETHKALATWNKAGNIDRRKVDPKIRPYLEAGLKWQADNKFTPLYVEHRVYDPIFQVCGTLDMLGHFPDGKVDVLVDWKTNDHRMGQAMSQYQLASYGHAFAPKEVFRRIEVVLGPTGEYGPVNSFPVDSYIQDVNAFCALSIVAKLRRELGLLS